MIYLYCSNVLAVACSVFDDGYIVLDVLAAVYNVVVDMYNMFFCLS